MRMGGVKFSSVLFLVFILAVMGWVMQKSLLGQTVEAVRADTPGRQVATEPTGRVRIGIGQVTILPSLQQQLAANGQEHLVRRAAETIEGQLMDALQNTRKFEIVARQDLDALLKEQSLRPGVILDSADTKVAVPARIKGLQNLILTTIDDFVDTEQSLYSQDMGMAVNKRTLRMSAIVRIYDTSTGVLMESMAVPVQIEASGTVRAAVGETVANPRASDDTLYVTMINQLATAISQRAIDTLFPAKVIGVTGGYVTLNRGQGTAIGAGQVWEIFSAGQEMKDPDTGESLGREEMKVGEVVINEVLPKFSKGTISGDNRGVATGNIARAKAAIQAQ